MNLKDAQASLQAAVARHASIPTEEWRRALPLFQPVRFEKRAALIRAGAPADRLYFIVRGLVRLHYETEAGKDFNKSFAWEGMFVAGALGVDGARENAFGVEALEPAETLCITFRDFVELLAGHAAWGALQSAYLGWLAARKTRREKQLLLESAEERYEGFLHDFAEIAGRVPQYHIASYLGVTDVALSRIKKRLNANRPADSDS